MKRVLSSKATCANALPLLVFALCILFPASILNTDETSEIKQLVESELITIEKSTVNDELEIENEGIRKGEYDFYKEYIPINLSDRLTLIFPEQNLSTLKSSVTIKGSNKYLTNVFA